MLNDSYHHLSTIEAKMITIEGFIRECDTISNQKQEEVNNWY